MNSFKWNQLEHFVQVMCLDQSSCRPAKSVHDIYSFDAITRSTANFGRREWWKCIYPMDKRHKNHEKFLKVHISIYIYVYSTALHGTTVWSIIVFIITNSQKIITVYIRTLSHKIRQLCCSYWQTIIFFTYLKENRIRYSCKYHSWKWFVIWGKISLKYYNSIYEIEPVKSL